MSDERAANAIDRRLGERVRMRRLERNLSQEQLAEALGVTFQQVQKYEKGANRIAATRLIDMARALDVPITFFFEGLIARKGRKAEADAAVLTRDAVLATAEGMDLVKCFADIKSARVRKSVVALVRAMSDADP